jgi:hypothetical protein
MCVEPVSMHVESSRVRYNAAQSVDSTREVI